jgi:hypothetical protein
VRWESIALLYVSYPAVVSLTRSEFSRARGPLLAVVVVGWAWRALATVSGREFAQPGIVLDVIVPALTLLLGYRLSGLFFVRPNVGLERRLRMADERFLTRSGLLARFRAAPRLVQESFELCYLLVYLVVPAGAATLAIGHSDQVGRFWTVVFLAEFASYGMLPWIQTRPPRVLEEVARPTPSAVLLRRLNLAVLSRGSIQVNTVPSGHAAGAVATALAVGPVMPVAGAVFLGLAALVVLATVLGRYHYVVDSVLGVLVALAAWSLV